MRERRDVAEVAAAMQTNTRLVWLETPTNPMLRLTAREREIVGALSQSPSDKLITLAGRLGMSENTLRNHLTTVYSKLGVRGRLELHVFAAENGLTAG